MKKIYLMLLLFVAGSLIQKAGHAQNIFYEDFELGVPGSFTQSFVAGTTSWLSTGGVPGAGVTFPYSGATSAIFYSPVANQNQTELISPVINMSSGAYNLKFYHVAASAGGGQFTRLAVFI